MVRSLAVLVAIAVAVALVVWAWDGTGATADGVAMRIFLVGWAVAAVVISAGSVFISIASRDGQRVPSPSFVLAVQHVTVGGLIGLAVGTTDWTALRFAGWWQLWWTVPLLLAHASLVITPRRASRARR